MLNSNISIERKKEIRKKANQFREKCNLNEYGILNLFADCRRLGYKIIRYPIGENAYLGFTLKKDDEFIIFTNSSNRLSREIYTLAHEIGHCILHFENEKTYLDNNSTMLDTNDDIKEQEANCFANCILIPEDELKRFIDLEINYDKDKGLSSMDIANIMSNFSVSFEMALNRLEQCGVISSRERTKLCIEKMEHKVSNLLKTVGGNSKLNTYTKEIEIPQEYLDYAIFNYNHNTIPKETLENVLKYYQLDIEDVKDRIVENKDEDKKIEDLIGGIED